MRAAVLVLLCSFCATASAHASVCQNVPDPTERLACYDTAAPPATTPTEPPAKRPRTRRMNSSKGGSSDNWPSKLIGTPR
jgi:hypothetical protein